MESFFENDLKYSFVEQYFNQLTKLTIELESEKPDEYQSKSASLHRLFKYNVFDHIEPRRRQYLDKILKNTLTSLGTFINTDLKLLATENRSATLPTPSPISLSSRRSSPVRSSQRLRSRSNSSSSLNSNFFPRKRRRLSSTNSRPIEVITISSDEDDDDDEVIVLDEIKKESGGQFPAGRSVNLEDITSRFNENNQRADHNHIRGSQQSISNSSLGDISLENARKRDFLPKQRLMLVNRRNYNNFFYDKMGVIHMKSKQNVTLHAVSPPRLAILLHIIAKVLKLISTDNYMTKRELYYLTLNFCRVKNSSSSSSSAQTQSSLGLSTQSDLSQPNSTQQLNRTRDLKYSTSKLDYALDDLCCLVGCSKSHLRILAQPKGIVYGRLKYRLKSGQTIDCSLKAEGTLLPCPRDSIIDIETEAKAILLLEKDSVMQKILSQEKLSNFVEDYKLILFTGRGYPDITSRAFLNLLWRRLNLPILALTDADPHGLEIVCSYKFGCYSTAHESTYIAVPHIRWLGLLPSDIKSFKIPETKTIPHTINDVKKLESLSERPYLRTKLSWLNEIKTMIAIGRKAELEALDVDGEYLIKTYLPHKLRCASWL